MPTARQELEELRILAREEAKMSGQVTTPGVTPRQELEQLRAIQQQELPAQFEQRRRQEIESIPEIGQGGLLAGEDPVKVAAISPVLLATTDPREMANILSSTFKNIGITETPEGELMGTNNATGARSILNKPDISKLDVLQGLGIISVFSPAGALRTAGQRVAGAIGTEAALQTIQAGTGGEFDKEDVALAGLFSGAGEVVGGPVMQSLRQRKQAKELGARKEELGGVETAAKEAEEASKQTGIGLFEGQVTAVPSRLEEQAFVGSLPAGATIARNALLKQNKEATAAVDNVLELIAAPSALETGPQAFRTAANQALKARKLARSEASSPIYKQAFRRQRQGKTPSINTEGLETKLQNIIGQYDPKDQIGKSMTNALNKIQRANGDLQKLHIAKIELDQIINNTGKDAVGNTTKRFLRGIKDDLVENLTTQSPSYRAARDEYVRTSPDVVAFENSILGQITKVKDVDLKSIAQKIFNPAETNPQIIRQAKKTIEEIDPQAWRDIARTELERRLGAMKADLAKIEEGKIATIENVPGQIKNAIFGKEKQRRVLFQGAPDDVKENLRFLEVALERASQGRPGGSQTAVRQEIKQQLRPGVGQAIRNFFQQPITTISQVGEDIAFDKKVNTLAKALYDPEWKARMGKIRRMNPTSAATSRAMLQLLNDISLTEEEEQQ